MEKAVFVDTGAWIGLLNADDEHHAFFASLFEDLRRERRPLLTTDWVLAETGNGLARFLARSQFGQLVDRFQQSPNCELVRIDADLFRRALDTYTSASDKTWGMVDCASFTVMRDAGVLDVATPDVHFAQAGFRRLEPVRKR